MRLNIPQPLPGYDAHNERDFRDALVRETIPVVTTDEAVPQIYLRAPDGGAWKVTVSDTGVLTTEKVRG